MKFGQRLVEVNPDLTPEVMAQVDAIIEQYREKPGALIPVLEECQGVTGYLPVELQEYISRGLKVSASSVYGVVTFYSFFTMVPKGRHTIKVCMGTACYVKGAGKILDKLQQAFGVKPGEVTPDGQLGLAQARCLGACGLAPAVVYDQEILARVDPATIGAKVQEKLRGS
jgi:NADH:ubiquinone oxidoreductase subunit E